MSPDYEAMIVRSINDIWKKGRIYNDQKPVFWCPVCITALAEAEVEYKIKNPPQSTYCSLLNSKNRIF